jgi:Fe2+ or Zn2+ uptake regulation protein
MPRDREEFMPRLRRRKQKLQRDAAIILVLHKHPNSSLEEIVKEFPCPTNEKHRIEKPLKYDLLPFLIEKGIVKKFKDDGEITYALSDYEDEDAKIKRTVQDFELLRGRWPNEEEIGSLTGSCPETVKPIMYKLAPTIGWKHPSENNNTASRGLAMRRLELAAWFKLGCKQADFVKREWADEDEHAKATLILEKYPEYLPKIVTFKIKGDIRNRKDEKFYYTLTFPMKAQEFVGVSDTEQRMVSLKDFEACRTRLKIEQRDY